MKVRTSYAKFFFFFLVVSVLIHTLLTVNGLKVRKLGEISFCCSSFELLTQGLRSVNVSSVGEAQLQVSDLAESCIYLF